MLVCKSLPVWLLTIVLVGPLGVAQGAEPGKVSSVVSTAEGKATAGVAAAATPAVPSKEQYGERLRRLAEIRKMSQPQLERKLAATVILDADNGLPLLREQALCRVAIERVQRDLDDLSSIPEVRRAVELLRSPALQTRLVALLKLSPNEMLKGLLKLLDESQLTFEDLVLLSRMKTGQAKLAEYQAWQKEIDAKVVQLIETAASRRTRLVFGSGLAQYERVEKRKKRLQEAATRSPEPAPGPEPIDVEGLEKVIRSLIQEGSSK